jgi:germination protein YpeB
VEGAIPCWGIRGVIENGVEIEVLVVKKGGNIRSALPAKIPGRQETQADKVQMKRMGEMSAAFLKSHNYPEMTVTYAQYYDGVAVFNLAPLQQDVVLYPDLIKVWVDMATGKVIGMDAQNYLMFHTDRALADPAYSLEEAQERVAQKLKISNTRLVLVPTDDLKEVLCYEFNGANDEDEFLVHIDTQTGQEVDILQIIHAENGTMVY